jgi:hypothetical protein
MSIQWECTWVLSKNKRISVSRIDKAKGRPGEMKSETCWWEDPVAPLGHCKEFGFYYE